MDFFQIAQLLASYFRVTFYSERKFERVERKYKTQHPDPRSTSKRSSMIQSGPTTPKTPRSLSKRALVFTREDSPLKMTFVAIDKEGNDTIF